MTNSASLDVAIIGGGHNGLVCACYLAAAGLGVEVFERRHIVGGAAVTEEFFPGFRNSTASYTVSLLHPRIIRDLRLKEHGLRVVLRPFSNFLPLPDGRYFKLGGPPDQRDAEVRKFSVRDAECLPRYYERIEAVADVLREVVLHTPPNVGGGITDLMRAAGLGRRLRKLSMPQRRDLLELFTKSAGEILDYWFEGDPIKAAFGFDAVVGNFASPYTPGSAYVLLHHAFGEVEGQRGVWGHAIGGMGAITQAMAAEARRLGVRIHTDAPVQQVRVHDGRATGIVLKWKCGSATLRMNVALSELPDFTCLRGTHAQPHHSSGIIIAPSLRYMDRAYHEAREHGWSADPVVEVLIPSTVDDSLTPPGAHVASLFCQHFSPDLGPGTTWDEHREQVADLVIDTVDRYAPNFRGSVLGRMVLTPLDLEQKLGLVGGDIFHGALSLDQLFSARPVMGYADYRSPVKGLYLCGSGAHPGGGVTGLPGRNAAREVLRDARRKR
jgi:phytoene dehydrogenase-like protein